MRSCFVPCLLVVAAALGCGNGIGKPIVEREPGPSRAGSPSGGDWSGEGTGARGGYPGYGGRGPDPGPAYGGRGTPWVGGMGGGDGPPPECAAAQQWPEESAAIEEDLYEFLVLAREAGFPCMTGAVGTAVPPVSMKPELRCAARLHSRDMAERSFFDHVNPDGVGPEDRVRRTGYDFRVAGESIARGEASVPFPALGDFFSSGGAECENLVDPRFDSVGIGYYEGLWTLDFAGP